MDKKKDIRTKILARRDALNEETRVRKSTQICRELLQLVEKTFTPNADAQETCSPEITPNNETYKACPPNNSFAGTNRPEPIHGDRTHELHTDKDPGRSLCIAVYAAMRSEVNLQAFVDEAFARGWDICFPCMVYDKASVQDSARMAFYRVPNKRFDNARALFLDHPVRSLPASTLKDAGYTEVAPTDLDVVAVPLVAFDSAGNRLGYGGGNYDRLLPHLRADALVVGVAFDEQEVPTIPYEPHDLPLARIIHA